MRGQHNCPQYFTIVSLIDRKYASTETTVICSDMPVILIIFHAVFHSFTSHYEQPRSNTPTGMCQSCSDD